MQITDHVYSTHIQEDPSTFGAMHPAAPRSISWEIRRKAWS